MSPVQTTCDVNGVGQMNGLNGPPRQRERKTDVPFGWTLVYRDYFDKSGNQKRKAVWRCAELQRTLTGEVRRCIFCCKKSRIGRHEHEFTLSARDDPELQTQRTPKLSENSLNKNVVRLVGEFAGSEGLSVSVASSNVMRKFIISIMNCALTFREAYPHILFDPDALIPRLNRRKIREALVRAGDQAFLFLEQQMEHYSYVNIMLDAGTVLTMRIVHTVVANPFSEVPPIPIHATEKEGNDWCIEDYMSEISSVIAEMKSRGKLIPVAICHDRLRAQSVAIDRVLQQLRQGEEPTDGLIVDVPCMNHLLNNAFSSSCEGKFKKMISDVDQFANRLRTRQAILEIGTKCPVRCPTRWIYITDTLNYIVRRRARIQQFLAHDFANAHEGEDIDTPEKWNEYKRSTEVPSIIFDLYSVLMPFKFASLSFESEASRLSDVIPVVTTLQRAFKQLLRDELISNPIACDFLHEILCQWLARLEVYLPREAWACWALTRHGRYKLRKRMEDSVLVSGNKCDYSEPNLRKNGAAQYVKEECLKLQALLHNQKAGEEEEEGDQQEPGQESEDDSETETLFDRSTDAALAKDPKDMEHFSDMTEQEQKLQKLFEKRLAENRTKSLDDLLHIDVCYQTYEKALDVLTRYCMLLESSETPASVRDRFDGWLYGSGLPCLELERSSEYEMWIHFCKYDYLRPLSRAAVRLVCVGTSESSVERLISAHKYLVHDRMTNLSSQVLLARLQLQTREIAEERQREHM